MRYKFITKIFTTYFNLLHARIEFCHPNFVVISSKLMVCSFEKIIQFVSAIFTVILPRFRP